MVVEFKDKHLKNFDRLLLAKINEVFGNLSTLVINYVHWDILEIVMAYTFEDCLEPTFYSEILKIYQNGFFPCGWRGKFPHGNMLIYYLQQGQDGCCFIALVIFKIKEANIRLVKIVVTFLTSELHTALLRVRL